VGIMNNDGTRPEEDLTGDARSIFPTTSWDAPFFDCTLIWACEMDYKPTLTAVPTRFGNCSLRGWRIQCCGYLISGCNLPNCSVRLCEVGRNVLQQLSVRCTLVVVDGIYVLYCKIGTISNVFFNLLGPEFYI